MKLSTFRGHPAARVPITMTFALIVAIVMLGVARLHGQGRELTEPGATPRDRNERGLLRRFQDQVLYDPPIGAVMAYAGKWTEDRTIQTGWMLCDGRAVDASKYPDLAAALGETDGKVQLPDLCGRTVIGAGKGLVLTGQQPLTERSLNESGGEETHSLSIPELPAHSHPLTDNKHKHGGLPTDEGVVGDGGRERSITSWFRGSKDTAEASSNISIGLSGENKPHNTMPPFRALYYIIKIAPSPLR